MKRSEFIKHLGILGVGAMGLNAFLKAAHEWHPEGNRMPALFLGHGSPMNAIAENPFTTMLSNLGQELPAPKAILVVSAHWLSRGSRVTGAARPQIMHDFYGFPDALYEIEYPVPGTPAGAKLTAELLQPVGSAVDEVRGLDHGAWTVLRHMYPQADVNVFQLSIDVTRSPAEMMQIGELLRSLRDKGVLLIASGNLVHNLQAIHPDEAAPVMDWAEEFDSRVKEALLNRDFQSLVQYDQWGAIARQAHPSNDHYLPLMYTLGLCEDQDEIRFDFEGFQNGSISMRCVRIG